MKTDFPYLFQFRRFYFSSNFNAFFGKMMILNFWMDHKKVVQFISNRGLSGVWIPKFCILARYVEFLFFIQFWCIFFFDLFGPRAFGSIFYGFGNKLNWKRTSKVESQNFNFLFLLHPILYQKGAKIQKINIFGTNI